VVFVFPLLFVFPFFTSCDSGLAVSTDNHSQTTRDGVLVFDAGRIECSKSFAVSFPISDKFFETLDMNSVVSSCSCVSFKTSKIGGKPEILLTVDSNERIKHAQNFETEFKNVRSDAVMFRLVYTHFSEQIKQGD
jgi:hypothetical protein